MELDPDLCYRAIESRDSRFDGRFFTGVLSTGIYCRPVCPARTPRRDRVRFFACAAAAEDAGFRACKRCRPDAAPGDGEWDRRGDLLGRAVRLIDDGVADTDGVAGLARRLHVSERHLHRLFVADLGAPPQAVARTRRTQLARQLVDHTDLPLTEIAFAAGFSSIRHFNTCMRTAFGMPPSELRRRSPASPAPSRAGGPAPITLKLAARTPFDGAGVLDFLGRRGIVGVESFGGDVYRRALVTGGTIELRLAGPSSVTLTARLLDVRLLRHAVTVARRLLDLDADAAAITDVLGADPLLARIVAKNPGLRVPGAADGFELAVRAVLGQQVSLAGAATLAARVVARHGAALAEPDGDLTHTFPTAEALAGANLDGLGLTGGRIRSLHALADAVLAGDVVLDGSDDPQRVEAALVALPGIGPWTAHYVALRALRDPDAFPAADLGLRRALERLGLSGTDVTPKAIEARAEAWRPWRAYALMHLWHSLGDKDPS